LGACGWRAGRYALPHQPFYIRVSCIAYYLRERRSEFNLLLHGLIPFASFILFIPVLLAALGVNFAGRGITPLASPANEAPYVIYGWLAAGVLVLIYFLATDRSRIARTGLVFEEQAVEAECATKLKRGSIGKPLVAATPAAGSADAGPVMHGAAVRGGVLTRACPSWPLRHR
jgi:hypothetical protein